MIEFRSPIPVKTALGVSIVPKDLIVIGTTAATLVVLYVIVQHTRLGRAMRAVSQDLVAARLMGIDTDAVINRTFVIGGFLGGIAGTLLALVAVIEPLMGFMPGLNAFVASVVGGIGSIPGAFVALIRHVRREGHHDQETDR